MASHVETCPCLASQILQFKMKCKIIIRRRYNHILESLMYVIDQSDEGEVKKVLNWMNSDEGLRGAMRWTWQYEIRSQRRLAVTGESQSVSHDMCNVWLFLFDEMMTTIGKIGQSFKVHYYHYQAYTCLNWHRLLTVADNMIWHVGDL